jgi:ATP-dependent RNA helicase DeaD
MTNETTTFSELNLPQELLTALNDMQFVNPSPIQQQIIPSLIEGRDAIAVAQTGTGKTAGFALPILSKLILGQVQPQALILAPTRELAIQVAAQFELLGKYLKGLRVVVLCGGQDYRPQLKTLRDGAHIVVGTPGRILDHIERNTLQLNNIRTFVLDEADEMLRMGFIEDVEHVLSKLPTERQIALFSATMPPRIRQIANNYLKDPVSVEIKMDTATVKSTEQHFVFASQAQKPEALLRILAVEDPQGVIVFVRTKSSTEEVAESLIKYGHRAMAIHGDLTQSLRERIISQFKQGAIDVLVATDVAARGLDVERVTHVINYDMAHDCETYVHRIGRTGRAGRSGMTILFVTPRESRMLSTIERHTRQNIEKMAIPNDHMIQTVREKRFLAKIGERLQHENLSSYQRMVDAYIESNPEVSATNIAAVMALMLHQDKPWRQELDFPKSSRPMKEGRVRSEADFSNRNPRAKNQASGAMKGRPSGMRDNRDSRDNSSQELYRLDVGRVHGVKPGNIVGAIANEAGLQSRYITGIKINDDHSTVYLPKLDTSVMQGLSKAWVCGRQLKLTALGVV